MDSRPRREASLSAPEAQAIDLRVADPALRPGRPITFSFNGAPVAAFEGETIAAALAAAGIVNLGRRRDGSPRGVWCGMGVCQECLVNVDGAPSRRACVTAVTDGASVDAQGYAAVVPPVAQGMRSPAPTPRRAQVLVVGGGPAGLSAARAVAMCGGAATIVDERPVPGGQYFKQIAKSLSIVDPAGIDAQARRGADLIGEVERLGVTILRNAAVWGAFGAQELAVSVDGAPHVFAPERLVLATGVYERGVPVPGWTLPGFMTTGAAQTFLRAYRVSPGRRVLVAGNGPLNLQLAAELVAAGVDVVAVVEAAPPPSTRHVADVMRAAMAAPALLRDGLRYRARLRRAGVPIVYASALVGAQGVGRVEACTVARIGPAGDVQPWTTTGYAVDAVCVGYGFLPSNAIARALGCRHAVTVGGGGLSTIVDDDGRTSVSGVYAVGDAVRLRGAHVARCQGFVSGCAVARSLGLGLPPQVTRELGTAKRQLRWHLAFQKALWRLFAAPALDVQLASADTIVCRCEGVARKTIDEALQAGATSLGAVKRRTRAGMGRCQGRYCEGIVAAMMPPDAGAPHDELFHLAPRAPVTPIRVDDLV